MDIGSFAVTAIPRILFGEGRFAGVPEVAASYGRQALVVTGSRWLQSSPNWPVLTEGLREAGVSWEAMTVEGEPSPELVDGAVSSCRRRGIDVVLAVGGGSVIDAAKAIAALLPTGASVMDHLETVGRGVPYNGPPTPCVAVPTTAGTGAEATRNAVLSSRGPGGFKRSFRHDLLVPKVAVVDPALTHGSPPELTAAAGMDALTQLIESYVSTGAGPFTDALALSGIAAVKDGLFAAYQGGRGEPSGRAAMSYAALLSGITLTHAGLGVVHGLASPLGAFFPIPHGIACAALLAAAARVNIETLRRSDPAGRALDKYSTVGAVISGVCPSDRQQGCDLLIRTLSEWTERLHTPGLAPYGVEERDFAAIASGCSAKTNPVELTQEQLAAILRGSL